MNMRKKPRKSMRDEEIERELHGAALDQAMHSALTIVLQLAGVARQVGNLGVGSHSHQTGGWLATLRGHQHASNYGALGAPGYWPSDHARSSFRPMPADS